MSFLNLNLGDTHLILFLTTFSVFLLWGTTWTMIERKRIIIFAPFLLIGLSTCIYAGLLLYSSFSIVYILILRGIYLLTVILLFILFLKRAVWKD